MISKLIRVFVNYIIRGTLVVVPLAAAIFLIVWVIASIDSALNLATFIFEDDAGHPIYIPGLGILTMILVLLLAGIIFTNLVSDPILKWCSFQLNRIPLFNTLYSSIKDFTEAFVGDAKKFNEPVLVEVNEMGLKKIGFLTQHDLSKLGLEEDVIVYFPYSYSFSGQVVVVHKDRVKKLNMSATDAMKLVVSGGVSGF